MSRQIIIDTETTGLSPEHGHRVIEIAALELKNRQFTGNNFHCYLNPRRPIDPAAVAVHGITEKFLLDKPLFIDIAEKLWSYLQAEEAEIIAHNAKFDINFLNHEFSLVFPNWQLLQHKLKITDSLAIAKEIYPGKKNNLDALCARLGVNNKHRNLHGAMVDAELLAQVYLSMTSHQENIFLSSKKTTPIETNILNPKSELHKLHDKLIIISANPAEEILHQDFCKQLAKNSKNSNNSNNSGNQKW